MSFFWRNINNSRYFTISTILFSMSWLWLSFTYSLRLAFLGVSYEDIGIIGISTSLPFILVSFLYRKSRRAHINFALKFPFAVLAVISAILLLIDLNLYVYIFLIATSGLFQSMWWIAAEIETGLMSGDGKAEKYSAAWAIPSGLFPIFSGTIIQYGGYRSIYFVVVISSIIGFLIQPVEPNERKRLKEGSLDYLMLMPMLLVGLAMGYTAFVLTPLLKNSGYSYFNIGLLLGIFGISFSLGSIISNYSKKISTGQFAWFSSIFVTSYLLLIINFSFYSISLTLFLAGLGGSMGFSKVLSYIGETESPRDGVFFYETFFSLGFVTGSFSGGFLLELYGYRISLLLFIPSIIFSIFTYKKLARSNPPLVFRNNE